MGDSPRPLIKKARKEHQEWAANQEPNDTGAVMLARIHQDKLQTQGPDKSATAALKQRKRAKRRSAQARKMNTVKVSSPPAGG